jgi:hypothetical protein
LTARLGAVETKRVDLDEFAPYRLHATELNMRTPALSLFILNPQTAALPARVSIMVSGSAVDD